MQEDRIKLAYEKAYSYEKAFEGCSQPLLLATFEILGIENNMMLKAVSGFAGGISRMKSICGALLTGILVLGIKYGRESERLDRFQDLIDSYKPVQELVRWFDKEFGSTNCYEICKVDLSQPAEREEWIGSGRVEHCNQLIGKTAGKVIELIDDKT